MQLTMQSEAVRVTGQLELELDLELEFDLEVELDLELDFDCEEAYCEEGLLLVGLLVGFCVGLLPGP